MNMKKSIMGALLLFSLPVFAQTRSIEHDFSAFDAIVVSDGFSVSLSQDETYGAKLIVDDVLEAYVKCYVKGETLFVDLDEKAVPKEYKKLYRGRNAPTPVLNVTVYAPMLNSITLTDQASFTSLDPVVTDHFNVSLSGNAVIRKLAVRAKTVKLVGDKKSSLTLDVTADELSVKSAGSAKVNLDYDAPRLSVDQSGSSVCVLNGNAEEADVLMANSASLTIGGSADDLRVEGSGSSSKVDASALPVKRATVAIAGATVQLTVDKVLELDLSKGATVNYSGDPTLKVIRIQNSSLLPK